MLKKLKYNSLDNYCNDYFEEMNNSFDVNSKLNLKKIVSFLEQKYKGKNNIYVCGNGGSAAIANHFECDHKKILSETKKINPRLISLCSNTALLTAISNDISYKDIFKKQLEYLANKGDVLITISSSGNSENIIRAIKFAKKNKMKVVSFSGFNGGRSRKMCDLNLHVNSQNYGVIENLHHAYMNIISQFIKIKILTNSEIKKYKF